MKIVNLAYRHFPDHDPERWIKGFRFFYGIWEQMAIDNEIVYLHFTKHKEKFRYNGVTHWFMKKKGLALLLPLTLHSQIKSLAADVVVVHGLMTPLQVLLLRWQLGRRVRIVMQHHAEPPARRPLKKLVQRLADRITDVYFFTGKDHAAPWLVAGLIADEDKIREIMEVSSVFSPGDRDAARNAQGISAARIYLWVGHLNANKNPLLAAGAFLRFIEDSGADAALYMIFQSNALKNDLETLLASHPAGRRIHLVGKVSHEALLPWYSAADFIISSSYYEGSGVAVCEGMSCGCIPILTDIPSFRFMTDGRCGLLYEAGNEEALLAALHQSAGLNIEIARANTLQRFGEELSFRAIAGRIQEALSGLMP